MDSTLGSTEGASPTDTLTSDLEDSVQISQFRLLELQENEFVLFKVISFMVICYSRHKTVIQRIFKNEYKNM